MFSFKQFAHTFGDKASREIIAEYLKDAPREISDRQKAIITDMVAQRIGNAFRASTEPEFGDPFIDQLAEMLLIKVLADVMDSVKKKMLKEISRIVDEHKDAAR